MLTIQGHYALVECEQKFLKEGKNFTLITQNIDGLFLV
jgi:NAD-dependent SIR2 family protein deacetylase